MPSFFKLPKCYFIKETFFGITEFFIVYIQGTWGKILNVKVIVSPEFYEFCLHDYYIDSSY